MLTFFKPRASKFDRYESKQTRRQKVRNNKLAEKREAQAQARAIRAACWGRDGGKCRACGKVVKLRSDSPFDLMHAHHIIFRSAGGADELSNRLCLCGICHDDVHRHVLTISGDPYLVLFTKVDNQGTVVKVWESPCP